ncbi:MAG: NAD-dependent epimerase/dehydratase family protein [Acidobacteria bacterium]|nr:NAD-dependent epimerase/dehydratase family protein [Acidobacteriota bacterium]
MRTAFVAGATGYTGREVVRLLREQGVRTVAHVRPGNAREEEWRGRLGSIDVIPWERGGLVQALRVLDPGYVVFSLLGTTRARGRAAAARGDVETYETVDYGLTVMLLEAAREAGGCGRFVYLSAAGVSGTTSNEYLRVRWRVEEAIRASGVSYTIARPSFITGADRDEKRTGEQWGARVSDAALAAAGWLGMGRMRERYRSTTNTVLAAALVRGAWDEGWRNRVVESEGLR